MNLWTRLVNWEHWLERQLGLHGTPADVPEDDAAPEGGGAAPASPGGAVAAKAGSAAHAQAIRDLAANVTRYWLEIAGEPIQPQELELVLSLSGLETTWGLGWTDKMDKGAGDMRGSNNYGARQDRSAGPAWHLVAYGDTRPPTSAEIAAGHTENVPMPGITFRYFDAGEGRSAAENGAYYFVKDLVKQWPSAAALRTGDAAAFAHRLGPDKANGGLGYYGGFGTSITEREGGYTKALASRLPEVVAALGYAQSHATVPTSFTGGYRNTASGAANDPPLAGASSPLAAIGPVAPLPEPPPTGPW